MKTLEQTLDSYKVVITPLPPEDGPGYLARYEELGFSVRGIGATQAEALADLKDLTLDTYTDLPTEELPCPKAEAPWADYSGRITLRMPKVLHAKVYRQASEQGVSLNQWICHILESATTAVDAGCEFGARSEGETVLFKELAAVREMLDRWSTTVPEQAQQYGPLGRRSAPKRSPLQYSHLELVDCA